MLAETARVSFPPARAPLDRGAIMSTAIPSPADNLRLKRTLLDANQMARSMRRMAGEIIERNRGSADLLLVGIRTRGVPIADFLGRQIEAMEGASPPIGVLDITLYRDDLSTIAPQPLVRESSLPVDIDGRTLVLCDDVLYTGRTVRAALDALMDYGRPRAVQLAVLIDRGHRELPIHADFVGEQVRTTDEEVIKVSFASTDGHEDVKLLELVTSSAGPAS
jgi:pyrimidine operon attenuation protein/uracil phosphoribosyltransferase